MPQLIAVKLELSKTPRGKTTSSKPGETRDNRDPAAVGLLPSINDDRGRLEMADPNRRDLDYSTGPSI